MAKNSSHPQRNFTVPLALVAGIAGGTASTVGVAMRTKDVGKTLAELSSAWTGYNPTTGIWDPTTMQRGLLPALVGLIVHLGASKLGANKALGRAHVPLVRI